jgi:(R,R)-butanediol dehydrogenase / meso-butanediol dehydrogenase / diacetyl reductase
VKAVQLVEAHQMQLVELGRPEPDEGQVLLRVEACGVCGSDVSAYKLGLGAGVLGHEIAARVEATGALATIDPKLPCGECADCRSGHENRCIDTLTKPTIWPGGYSEWLVAPRELVFELPAGTAPEVAALAEPLSVAIHAAARSEISAGSPALVVGLGSIGLLTVVALRAAGAGDIYAIEPNPARRELGLHLGVKEVVGTAGEARTRLDRVPTVIECSGRPDALQGAIDMADSGGTVVLAGIAVAEVTFVPVFLITRELRVLGSITATHADFRRALELLPLHPELADISTPFTLEELPALFERLASGDLPPAKPLLRVE